MIVLMLIVAGLILGSFINALVWRLHEGRDWVSERSECTKCHHQLGPLDLVPILSYVFLRGKCRYCHKPIGDTPLPEILLPVVFAVSYVAWPMELHGVGLLRFGFWLFYLVIFLALTISDLRWFLLPDKLVAVLTGATVVELGVRILFFGASWHAAAWAGAGALLVSGLFYILFQVSKGKWIGGGDVKLGVSLGLLAGNPINALLLLFIASATGTVAVLPMILAGQAKKKTVIPFGPLLIFGLIFVRLWGKVVIDWYARLL